MNDAILVEVCVASLNGAVDAQQAGADRIELNYALELDGLTPGAGLVEQVVQQVQIPVIAMARPRGGDFCYSTSEWSTLVQDAKWLLGQGVAGIAFGCLDSSGNIELDRCREMRQIAGNHELVFHKAFDETRVWRQALNELVEVGIDRVMTSGQQSTAESGAATIHEMVGLAADSIEILPAGRIVAENALKIVEKTGVSQLHGSFSSGQGRGIAEEIRRAIRNLTA